MLQLMFRASLAVALAFLFLSNGCPAIAQIAPTNSATVSGSVNDSSGVPVVNATVTFSGPKEYSTHTDAHGLFVLVGVPFGTYHITAAAANLGTATRDVSVEGDVDIAIRYEASSMHGLKVIANVSSSANASFNVTPASVTQVSPIQNALEGKTSWRTILEQIPGVAQAGLANGRSALAAFPDGPLLPVQISINGTLPYETATLLDDMPLIGGSFSSGAAGAGTDISVYPLNGFGSADVVRGPGASAPSIVDSIGGSFVLHAPGAVSNDRATFSLSTDPYGGIVANALVAARWKKLSAVVTYGVNDSPGPLNRANIPAFTAFAPSTVDGQSFVPYFPPCNPPTCQYGSYLFNPNYSVSGFPYYGYLESLLVCCEQATSAWSQHSGSIALNYELSPSVSAEIFYAGQTSQEEIPYQIYTTDFAPDTGYAGSIPRGMQLFNAAGYLLSPLPVNQTSNLLEEKITAQVGNGLLRLAALQNRVSDTNSFNSPSSATLQLFGSGTVGGVATSFNGGTYNVTYPSCDYTTSQSSNNRDLLLSYATPLGENAHAGFSFVQSYYDIPSQSSYYSGGAFLFGSATPPDVSQTTSELRVFVGGTPSDKTSLDLSAYFVNAGYHIANPVGLSPATGLSSNGWLNPTYTYAAPRLGFVWRPTAAVAVRAAAGGGFAEAPLNDLVGSSGSPGCFSGICTVTLTNVNLQPEKSFGFDLGTDIKLRRDTIASLDVYRTNLYGQFYNATSVTGTYLGSPLYTTQYGNLGESRYEGILLDIRREPPHGIYWALSGGLTRGFIVSLPAGFYNTATCTECANLDVVPNVNFSGTFTTAVSIPYAQGVGTLGYRWSAEKYADLVGTYYGNNNTYFRPAFVELDGHLSYPLSKNASLLMTFRNITGIYDGAVQTWSADNFSGAPTVAGLPFPQYGEEYGPRTVILTTLMKL